MKILSTYWRDPFEIVNLGDYVTQYIIEKFGHSYEAFGSRPTKEKDTVLIAVGSILEPHVLNAIPCKKIVWGAGSQGNAFNVKRDDIEILAVRGPKTRDLLELPEDIPLGDPALLLPLLTELTPNYNGKVIYAPHCSLRDSLFTRTLSMVGADEFYDITHKRSEFLARIQELIDADFALCGSLHACIIRQAFGLPWALCIPNGVELVMPFKHADWFSYLELDPFTVSNIEEGRDWWEKYGSKGKTHSLTPLLESFPYPHEYL